MFSEKLESQGWLDLFTDIKRGCSIPDLVEFYTNCVITNRVVTSTINNHDLRFDAKKLGEMLGIPSDGFDVYIREDKNVLGDERLLELTCKLAPKSHLIESQSVRKGEIMPLHRLLF